MKKQVFSVLLTLCMASSTMPATVFGAEEGSNSVWSRRGKCGSYGGSITAG